MGNNKDIDDSKFDESSSDEMIAAPKAASLKRTRVKTEPTKKVECNIDESSEDEFISTKKRKAVKKEKKEDNSDDDFESKKVEKTPIKRAKKEVVDSDSDGEEVATPAKKKKKPATSTKKTTEETAEKKRQEKLLISRTTRYNRINKSLEEELPEVNKRWWRVERLPDGIKWRTLSHNGLIFPPEYEPIGVKMLYDGEEVDLTPEQEEVAGFYGSMLDSPHAKKETFQKNFFHDFLQILNKNRPRNDKHKIREFSKCDFNPIFDYYKMESERKKNLNPAQKKALAEKLKEEEAKYYTATMDGMVETVGNPKVEPPGLFRGRGEHPKTGHVKKRIMPEDITINIGKNEKVPEPLAGHKWKAVVHKSDVTWIAGWSDPLTGHKYVFFSAASRLKGQSDMDKFEKARRLKTKLSKIRASYLEMMKGKDPEKKQMATAMYLIDHLALRVGNEKSEDEADTVGCCSLRVEHVTLTTTVTPVEGEKDKIDYHLCLRFLGKDSIEYNQTNDVPRLVYKNLSLFTKNKKGSEDLFDLLSVSALNNYLKTLMPGLSAKVFRTCNASMTLQRVLGNTDAEIATIEKNDKSSAGVQTTLSSSMAMIEEGLAEDPDYPRIHDTEVEARLLSWYEESNKQVAILCNHQRAPPTSFDGQVKALLLKAKILQDEIMANHKERKALASKPKDGGAKWHAWAKKRNAVIASMNKMEEQRYKDELAVAKETGKFKERFVKVKKSKDAKKEEDAKKDEDDEEDEGLTAEEMKAKKDAGNDVEYVKEKKWYTPDERPIKEPRVFKPVSTNTLPSLSTLVNKAKTLKRSLETLNSTITRKQALKNVSLTTSKINYLDPRITVTFCRKYHTPVSQIFNKALRLKFPWAMDVEEGFVF